MSRITLLTDFGTRDGYVAAMKGVIAAIAPTALVEDAAHDLEPGDVSAASWVLDGYWRLFPEGTIHVAVIDPGVGSDRRPIACSVAGHRFVGPDNGVFSRVLRASEDAMIVSLDHASHRLPDISRTFHGRDIFAPAAAHLAAGVPLEELGAMVRDPQLLPEREPVRDPRGSRGAVIHIDRFGNLISNIPAEWVQPGSLVRIGSVVARFVDAYSDVNAGELLALVGSRGVLEVAVRNGSAAERVWSCRDMEVQVTSPT